MGEKHSFVEVIESELECKLGCHGKLANKMLLYMFAYNDSYFFPLRLVNRAKFEMAPFLQTSETLETRVFLSTRHACSNAKEHDFFSLLSYVNRSLETLHAG